MSFKDKAIEAEDEYDFKKALEYYKKAEDELSIDDGSLIRYAELLYEFQEFKKAQEVFESFLEQIEDEKLLTKLAHIYEENKELDKALDIYKKLGRLEKIRTIQDKTSFQCPSNQIVKKFLSLFSGRENVFSIQLQNAYKPVRRSLKYDDVIEHFKGKKTLGIYQLKEDTTIKFAAYDVDIKKNFLNNENRYIYEQNAITVAQKLINELDMENIANYLEYTGNRGYHVWIFFDLPILSYKVKRIMEIILDRIELEEGIDVEIFPKQTELNGGLGNLIKIPLGIHRKTGKKCVFLDKNFEPVQNQLAFLMKIQENSKDKIESIYKDLEDELFSKPISNKIPKTRKQKNKTGSFKRSLRREIPSSNENDQISVVTKGCHVISQIITEIETQAFITEEEEEILIKSLINLPMGKYYLKSELEKTINFSQKRFDMIVKQSKGVPITCEEIRKMVLNKSLPIDLEKCVCKFDGGFNSPYAIVADMEKMFLEQIDINDIAKKIIKKNQERFEIEKEIGNLKKILSKKMGDKSEMVVEIGIIRKDENGNIRIII